MINNSNHPPVYSFKGRSMSVSPETGDYTLESVGVLTGLLIDKTDPNNYKIVLYDGTDVTAIVKSALGVA